MCETVWEIGVWEKQSRGNTGPWCEEQSEGRQGHGCKEHILVLNIFICIAGRLEQSLHVPLIDLDHMPGLIEGNNDIYIYKQEQVGDGCSGGQIRKV